LRAGNASSRGITDPAENAAQALRVRIYRSEEKSEKNNKNSLLHDRFSLSRAFPENQFSRARQMRRAVGLEHTVRTSHLRINKALRSLLTIDLPDSRHQLLEYTQ
jgi:hypothetical protein